MPDLTPRSAAYPLSEEGIVPEAYVDSEGVWTWAGGIAATSGFDVKQYKDKPAPMDVCLRATIDFMRRHYLPDVQRAFTKPLTEAQLAAALSFHWNTGAILTTQWVQDVNAGQMVAARTFLENHYVQAGRLAARRKREAALFFDGKWPSLNVPVWNVAKPSYRPSGGRTVDVMPMLQQILGGQ